jgi:predicted DNA-binding protein
MHEYAISTPKMNEFDSLLMADATMMGNHADDPMSGNVRIAVVIPEELKQRLDYLCDKEHRSLSGQVHMWIVQKVEEWERENLSNAKEQSK